MRFYDQASFDKIREQLIRQNQQQTLQHFQALADDIMENYDFRDIKKAIIYAKENTLNSALGTFDQKVEKINQLFRQTIDWLNKNSKRLS